MLLINLHINPDRLHPPGDDPFLKLQALCG